MRAAGRFANNYAGFCNVAWPKPRLHEGIWTMEGKAMKNSLAVAGLGLMILLFMPGLAQAAGATTGAEFQDFYDFINNAATGFLGRAIAITGGLIALGVAAATGRYVMAIGGVVLAVFGSLGPDIVDAIFGAVI